MSKSFVFDPQSFKGMEHSGWERNALFYDDVVSPTTPQAVGPLLDATGVGVGTRLLEVCCGPGYGAGAAISRGAEAVGVDFAQAMVEVARKKYPKAAFQQGDAENLSFGDASFDAAICSFGLLHLAEPEKALAEAYRVLVPGGRYAFTVWCSPDKCKFFGLILGAVQAHGNLDLPLPPAPPIFRFSDHNECLAVLQRVGFVEPKVSEIPLVASVPKTGDEQILDIIYKSTVRVRKILDLQTAEARERIHRAIVDGVAHFEKNGRIELPMPAVLASARKP
ncbi:MAG: methyltransferase domain-containing protein [Candidatus Tectomicrobia bacterium]|uniref:Methyltransferase domain-containing protein n=1 Tax=Tectimicrobiota bacterium TaxID=2528274 RepID=A0A933GN83_UNCTE|nr:methyltransferase domain-containing protein [Candidatus Tectomicrobia bacterium]